MLLVEDSPELADNLAELVAEANFDAQVVHSAEAALGALTHAHFDVVLSDLRLPSQSGVDLIRALRESGNGTPVILMSAFADDAAQAKARKLGVVAILVKPVDCAGLLGALATLPSSAQSLHSDESVRKD